MLTCRSLLTVFLITIVLASCSHLSKEECERQDWKMLGETDGRDGWPMTKYDNYYNDCFVKNGIAPDKKEYTEGRNVGLMAFCTVENGIIYGEAGHTYYKVCPPKLEKDFLQGFLLGEQKKELKKKEIELNEREKRLDEYSRNTQYECTYDSDCNVKDHCSFNKCSKTGRECFFDSDCSIKGHCSMQRCSH